MASILFKPASGVLRFLTGEDIFLSYARLDATTYTAALANRLTEQGFSCYLDQWDTAPGEKIPARVLRALSRSSMLVIIVSRAAAGSSAVQQEVESFCTSGRQIVPVDTDGALEQAIWVKLVRGAPITNESRSNLDAGTPGRNVTDRIENSARFLRQKSRVRRTFVGAAAALVLLAAASLWTSYLANQAAEQANRQATIAESRRISTDALRLLNTEPDNSLMLAVEAARRFDGVAARGALQAAIEKTKWVRAFLQGHAIDVADIDFSPDSRWLVSVEELPGKRLHMWNLQTLRHEVLVDDTDTESGPRIPGGGYNKVRFAPGGQYVIASNPISVDIVKASDKGFRTSYSTTAANPAAMQLATITNEHVVFRDDARRFQSNLQFQNDLGETPLEVFFTDNAEYLVALSKRHIRLWAVAGLRPFDFDDPEPEFERSTLTFSVPPNSSIKSLDIDVAGNQLAALAQDNVYVWDLETELPVASPLQIGRQPNVNDLALWPGRKDLVVTAGGGGSVTTAEPAIMVWEISSGTNLGTILSSFDRQFFSVAFSPDGRYLAAGDRNSHFMLWDLESGSPLRQRMNVTNVVGLEASFSDTFVVIVRLDGSLALLDPANGGSSREFEEICSGRVTTMQISSDDTKLLLGTAAGNLCIYDVGTGMRIASTTLSAGVSTAAFIRDGRSIFVADASGRIYRFSDATLEPGAEPILPEIQGTPLGMTFDSSAEVFLVGGNSIAGFDTKTGAIKGNPAMGTATWLEFSADGRQLAYLGLGDASLSLVEGEDLRELLHGQATLVPITRQLKGHTEPIIAAAFSQDGSLIATSALRFITWNNNSVLDEIIHPGDKYEIRLWNNTYGTQLGEPLLAKGMITQLSFSADAKKLYSLSATGEVHVWDLSTDASIAHAIEVLGNSN